VIQNAGDVAPKGDFVFRQATVEVDVLPPVDTSHWRRETVEEHVAEVRDMFLRALGQESDEDRTAAIAPPVVARKKLVKKKKSVRKKAVRKKVAPKARPAKKVLKKKALKKKARKKKATARKTE
ncbi:MAG: hypothetical protein OET41_07365, partial [Xanthomonadales bacterium]|nr:hypothetical protein [Xanthomonadales bacterium]